MLLREGIRFEMKFKVYEKDTDKGPLEFEFDGYKIEGSLLKPHNRGQQVSGWGFVNLETVAAVVREFTEQELRWTEFTVWLRGREKPLSVYAQALKVTETELSFCRLDFNIGAPPEERVTKVPMVNIYVAISEVVAVSPAVGFLEANLPMEI